MKYEPWLWDERPYAPDGFVPVWMWFDGGAWFDGGSFNFVTGELPRKVFDRLTAGTPMPSAFARTYLTRGEALQDLAQAEVAA